MFAPRSTTAPVTATSVGVLGGYAADLGGLPSFAADLRTWLIADRPGTAVTVVRAGEPAGPSDAADVAHQIDPTPAGSRLAAAAVNRTDVVIINYQADVFGGSEGDQVLDVLEWITKPAVVVVHDVHPAPTARQRFILEILTTSGDAVVTMSETGRRLLLDEYRVEPRKLMMIRHGATPPVPDAAARTARPKRRPTILTWGLFGPRMNVESVIRALALVTSPSPRPRHVVAGPPDPALTPAEAAAYQQSLIDLADKLGVADRIEIEVGPLQPDHLGTLVANADVVVLPHRESDLSTSSVLAAAVAAGKPVVSTSVPLAAELFGDGNGGILVPHDDPQAVAGAVGRILTQPRLAEAMALHNAEQAPFMAWPLVASQYRQLINALLRRPATTR